MRTVVRMANVSLLGALHLTGEAPAVGEQAPDFCRAPDGTINYAEIVPEITHEPAYEPALAALDALLHSD